MGIRKSPPPRGLVVSQCSATGTSRCSTFAVWVSSARVGLPDEALQPLSCRNWHPGNLEEQELRYNPNPESREALSCCFALQYLHCPAAKILELLLNLNSFWPLWRCWVLAPLLPAWIQTEALPESLLSCSAPTPKSPNSQLATASARVVSSFNQCT